MSKITVIDPDDGISACAKGEKTRRDYDWFRSGIKEDDINWRVKSKVLEECL